MTSRKTIPCGRCNKPMTIATETNDGRCWSCTGFVPDPPQPPVPNLDIPMLKTVKECANFANNGCIVRERGPCIVLEGWRCGWFEKAVSPNTGTQGRVCKECGTPVPKRHRFCPKCTNSRRRKQYRLEKTRQREARVLQTTQKSTQIVAATP